MERIKGQLKDHEELAMQVLSWIICAKRPLEIIELQHALAVEIGERELDQDNIPELEVMISVCAGLVTVDNDRRIIRLVHYTTLEYFVRSQKRWFPHANVHVTEACIAYLSFRTFNCVSRISEPEYEELLEENPFYDYAAFHWGDHARAAPAEKIQGPVLGFLKSPSKVSSSGRVVMEKFWYIGKRDVPIELTALHLTAFFGLKDAAEVLIQHADDPDFKDVGGRTPLSWAATCGNGELAKVLLKSPKVNPNSRDAKGRTPLSYAAERGHTSVVEAFIDIPNLNPNIEEYAQRAGHKYVMIGGRTPLSWAAANGHSGIVKLLLTLKVIDSDHPDLLGRTPLSFAARNGHEAIVNLLLARKEVNPNSTDRLPRHGSIVPDSTGLNTHAYGRTPLSWAAGNGHEEVVKLMLSTDRVHKNTVDSYRQSPLLWAAAYGHVAVVKLLLGERVDIDRGWIKPRLSPDFYWGWVKSPLFQVALTGDEAVACLLLKAGANVERKDEDGQTPLFFAAMAGHEAVARLLLEYGSNVELKDKYGQTPLFFAARAGHKAVVRLLLEHRANVKSEEKHS
jgi:ankyrin repeat protein